MPGDPYIDQGESDRQATTIGILPNDVLLGIFEFCRNGRFYFFPVVWDWHLLVHVCRRWRQIIFASPHGLDLHIFCTRRTPVRKYLGIWPAFPIVIDYRTFYGLGITPDDEDNITALLESEHRDRVSSVGLGVTGTQLEKIAAMMQEPFSLLKHVYISVEDENAPVLPGSFLGGSAPCLQTISFVGVPYPTLPALLLSASGLVQLHLEHIPPGGYISPEVMVESLAALPRLKSFFIEFQGEPPRRDRLRPPHILTRNVLPALAFFRFRGYNKYLESLVARIDSPHLTTATIHYLDPPVDFQVAHLVEFIDRSVPPQSTVLYRRARVILANGRVTFTLYRDGDYPRWDWHSGSTTNTSQGIDRRFSFSHLSQVLSRVFATFSTVVHLSLESTVTPYRITGVDEVEWQALLHQFSNVQTLKVSCWLAKRMAGTLEDITEEMGAELFPLLELICLETLSVRSIEKFVALRQLSGHTIIVVNKGTEFDKRLESYVK